MYEFNQDQKVAFDNGVIKGTGTVIGVSGTELPVIGATYIINVIDSDIDPDAYPYTAIALPGVHLEAIE